MAKKPVATITGLERVGPVRARHFGAFVEHGGRCVYTGIYEPAHPTADAFGFRGDVAELIKELGATTVRYPGGNFVSGYHWEDGIGPHADRPVRRELAWHTLETNQVGTDDFVAWCNRLGLEPMLALNLATRGVAEALALQDYVNGTPGSTLSDLRGANGYPEPHDVRMWCLGNEMDGPWQIGHMAADDYGKIAARTASAMRMADADLELVVCGSSFTGMSTFGDWERTVLWHTYDHVDFISCHSYYRLEDGDTASFLASSTDMQLFIDTTVGIIDEVKTAKNSTREVAIAFDEWNVWYVDDPTLGPAEWPIAPAQLQNTYTVLDAVVVGSLLITLLRNADRVHSANLAQLVNAIAPIMTATGGPAWRQTSFFPFSITSRLATGSVFRPTLDVVDYETSLYGAVPLVDAVVTFDDESGRGALFLVNRSSDEDVCVTVPLERFAVTSIAESISVWDADLTATNTEADPDRVRPRTNRTALLDGATLTVTLPPVSWTAVAFQV